MRFDLMNSLVLNGDHVKKWSLWYILIFLLVFQSCQPKASRETSSVEQQDTLMEEADLTSTPLYTYWDSYNFQDIDAINDPNQGEQAFVDFIYLFPRFDREAVSLAIHHMLDQARVNKKVFDFFVEQYRKYLYDPNSPMRNDLYYEPVLVYLLDSALVTNDDKIKTRSLLTLVQKNQVGSIAADFSFQQMDGETRLLSAISSRYTMLFFYEPGCSHCEQAIVDMQSNGVINDAIARKELTVLAVYPFGGFDIWKNYQKQVPDNWLNVFDEKEEIVKGGKYDLKATPTIFLLDSDKRVLLKDTDTQQLAAFFRANTVQM